MADRAFSIKEGDTSPPLFATLLDKGSGEPINLVGATVRFHMATEAGQVIVDEPAFVLNGGVTGGVRFDEWTEAHTATPGRYLGEFEVTFPDQDVQSFPTERSGFPIIISAGLA